MFIRNATTISLRKLLEEKFAFLGDTEAPVGYPRWSHVKSQGIQVA